MRACGWGFLRAYWRVLLVLSGCAASPGEGPEIRHGSVEQTQIELRVLATVDGPAGAAYIPAERTVYLTIYARDTPLTDAGVQAVRKAAESALEGEGIAVVVELDYGDPPVEE